MIKDKRDLGISVDIFTLLPNDFLLATKKNFLKSYKSKIKRNCRIQIACLYLLSRFCPKLLLCLGLF